MLTAQGFSSDQGSKVSSSVTQLLQLNIGTWSQVFTYLPVPLYLWTYTFLAGLHHCWEEYHTSLEMAA